MVRFFKVVHWVLLRNFPEGEGGGRSSRRGVARLGQNFCFLYPGFLTRMVYLHYISCLRSGVALTFEKLRIANAQHGKNCISSPAAKTTISTITLTCKLRTGLSDYVISSMEAPASLHWHGMGKGGGGGNLRCLDPRHVLYKPSLVGAKNEKTKRILMCEVTVFFAYSKRTAFSDLRSLFFFLRIKRIFFS